MVRLRRSIVVALLGACAALLTSCVEGPGPFFDKSSGLVDSYFTGEFSYVIVGPEPKRAKLSIKGKVYTFEEDGQRIGSITLHPFRQDYWIAQLELAKVTGRGKPYRYLLVRKTPSGFDVGAKCSKIENTCDAKSKADILIKLDKQAKALAADPQDWLAVRRDRSAPGVPVAQSENPSEDCNSDETNRKLSGCTGLIEKGGLSEPDLALAHSRRADAYIGVRDFDHAISDRRRAAELQPNDLSYQMRLSGAYQIRAAAVAGQQSEAAIADLTQAIQVDPTNYEAKLQRSAIFARQHKLAQAIEGDVPIAVELGRADVAGMNVTRPS